MTLSTTIGPVLLVSVYMPTDYRDETALLCIRMYVQKSRLVLVIATVFK